MSKQIKKIKKAKLCFLLYLFACVLLSACGKKDADNAYYIIETEAEQIFTQTKNNAEVYLLGTRFYHDEPVQLAGYRVRDPETGEKYINLHLCHTSGEEVTLWERIPEEYGYGSWYLDGEGNGYCIYLNEVIRYDKGGGERYHRTYDDVMRFTGACVQNKGDVLLLGNTQQGMLNLMVLEADTGELSRTGVTLDTESIGMQDRVFISANGKGFVILDSNGIWEGDTEKGRKDCIISFSGGNYAPESVLDFRILQDCTAQVLGSGTMETVRRVDISKERKILVLRVMALNDSIFTSGWLPEGIMRFNTENDEYYVVVDERQDENAVDFRERTDMELALGKGPDIVLNILNDPIALIAKGALEDLTPYMEASGIREEDYFPAAARGSGAKRKYRDIWG